LTIPFYTLGISCVLFSLPVSSSLGARILVHLEDTSVYLKLDSIIPNDKLELGSPFHSVLF
jgi:hypothetical protein